jgi:hypothetical protein
MKKGNFFARVWKFLKELFSDEEFEYKRILKKIEDEDELAENMIKNNQERHNIPPSVNDSCINDESFYVPDEDIVFIKKTPEVKVISVKKKKRILTYKLETKDGLILFEGIKISKFIKENKKEFSFNQKQCYKFALKYQDTRIFKEKYFISFKEVI